MKKSMKSIIGLAILCTLLILPFEASARPPLGRGVGRISAPTPGMRGGSLPRGDFGRSTILGPRGQRIFPPLAGSRGFVNISGRTCRDEAVARRYREVVIANAVAGLVNVLTGLVHPPVPPAPPVVPPPAIIGVGVHSVPPLPPTAPVGRWERRAVVVQPQRQEQYFEWVPEQYCSITGRKIGGGYYAVRTRIIPEVIQYQNVWVTP